MITSTTINNYQILDLLGLLEPAGEFVRLTDKAVVLKDEIPPIPELPKSRTFTLDKILNDVAFKKEDLQAILQDLPYLRYLRVFFARFRPDDKGRITQKADLWDKVKAWRYDIDVVKDEDLARDKEEANKRIEDKKKDILALMDKLSLAPNLLKRSNKGWHLIYVFNEFITREAYDTYLARYNKPDNKPEDSITDQFIAFELLSNYIPKRLAELEPQLDYHASSRVNMIATRFITEDLPAYLIHEKPYSLKEFRKAFEYLMDNTNKEEIEVVYKQGNKPYTIYDIPRETFLSLMDRCEVLKALDEDWENHGEREWYVMINYYAIRILYAETPQEAEELRQEFHEKSRRWKGNGDKHYTYEEAERQLQYYIRKQQESLKPPACRYIYHNLDSKYTKLCLTCQYKRFDANGNMIANFIFDGLKNDSLETIPLSNWELKQDGWYMMEPTDEGLKPVRVLPYFKIRAHYLVGDEDIELVDIVDKRGISTIKKVERKKDTYQVSPELIKGYGYINPEKITAIRKFLTLYIEKVKETRGVKISFLGYRFINGFWDIAVGGDGNYRRKDLGFIFYQQDTSEHWFIPSVQGSLDTFKAIYYQAFLLNDPALHLVIAHYLSWIGQQFIDNKSLKPQQLNPILILVGDAGTGKTQRAKIGAGLFGNPAVFSFTNISQAGLSNRFPMIKTPFVIDEVMTKSQRDEEKLGELLYNIGNKNGKMTSYATHDPIDVPVILTGETENLLIDKVFSSYKGLNRRSIVVKMTTEWRDNSDMLDMILDELHNHYGHILSYVKSLNTKDKEGIEEEAKKIYSRIELGDSSFKDLRKHLAVSLATFKHFYKSFIGFNLSNEEIDKKVDKVIKFVIKEIAEHQLSNIGDNVNYEDEIIKFISSVLQAQRNGKTLKGLSFKAVISKIDYKPSDKVGDLLKKFFWKKYPRANKTSVDYSFRDNNLLIIYPNYTQEDITETAEKILDLSKDEFIKWLKVAELMYGKAGVEKIKGLLLGSAYGNGLRQKFKELLTTLEPQPQPEPDIPF